MHAGHVINQSTSHTPEKNPYNNPTQTPPNQPNTHHNDTKQYWLYSLCAGVYSCVVVYCVLYSFAGVYIVGAGVYIVGGGGLGFSRIFRIGVGFIP